MTDTQRVQVSPMAVAMEATALNEHYRARNLQLSNEVVILRETIAAKDVEIAGLNARLGEMPVTDGGGEPDPAEEARRQRVADIRSKRTAKIAKPAEKG
jgi:hypothetical protein